MRRTFASGRSGWVRIGFRADTIQAVKNIEEIAPEVEVRGDEMRRTTGRGTRVTNIVRIGVPARSVALVRIWMRVDISARSAPRLQHGRVGVQPIH